MAVGGGLGEDVVSWIGGGGGGLREWEGGDDLALDGVVQGEEVVFEVGAYGVFVAGDGIDVHKVAVEGEEGGIAGVVGVDGGVDVGLLGVEFIVGGLRIQWLLAIQLCSN